MSYRIEDVLESAGDGAPAPRTSTDDIIAGAHRIRSRRRWATAAGAGGAVAVTVAVVVGLGGTTPQASRPQLPAAKPSPATSFTAPSAARHFQQPQGLTLTVGAARTGAWQVGPGATATFGYQRYPVYRDGKTLEVDGVAYPYPDGVLTFYRPGVFDPASFGVSRGARERYGPPKRITITGRAGVEREYTYVLPDPADMRAKMRANPGIGIDDPSIKTETFTRTAFAWQFDGRSWATFVPDTGREPLSRAESLAVVEALMPAKAEPVRAPFTIGWLPDGWSVTLAEHGPSDVVSRVIVDRRRPSGAELGSMVDDYPGGGRLTIVRGAPEPAGGPEPALTCSGRSCTLALDGEYHAVFERIGGGLSEDDARRVLMLLTFTTIGDRSTWRPVQSRF